MNWTNWKTSYMVLLILALLTGCSDRWEEPAEGLEGERKVRIALCTENMPILQARSGETEAQNHIESVNLFIFKAGEKQVHKKVYQYFDSTNDQSSQEISVFLTGGQYDFVAVCNWQDPEGLYNEVQDRDKLQQTELVLLHPDDAFMGKYVMAGSKTASADASVSITMERLASLHEFRILFTPDNKDDRFEMTEAQLCYIPKGCWLLPQADGSPQKYEDASKADWTYRDVDDNMRSRYFEKQRLEPKADNSKNGWEEKTQWGTLSFYSLLENRRGGLHVNESQEVNGRKYAYNDDYWEGSEALYHAEDWEKLSALLQYYKRYHAQQEPLEKGSNRKKFEFASYLAIKGFYQNASGTSEVTYYVYLGSDSYSDYNVCRNHHYKTYIHVRAVNTVDTRVEATSMEESTLSVPSEILDAHCNTIKGVFYSPDPWEVWVENPDKTPWLELSGNPVYRHVQMGQTGAVDQEVQASYYMSGKTGTLRSIYIHTDEYIPDLKDPTKNNVSLIRSGRIAFRKKGSQEVKYVTVQQYPAQLAVLHIKYDVHTMKEVRDTFYIERKLEKKYMPWGLESYWSFITDDLIASGLWDGLSNTRKLYQVALHGDKWGVGPAYDNGVIPPDCALGYVVNKNRDRDGNQIIDYDEIMWYFPARKEMQYLYKAVQQGLVTFDGTNSVFHCSTPSSADPGGITTGFSYYVKMSNGKYGIGQRDRKYNVLSLRRKHREWSGPNADTGNFTVTVETGWTDKEVIMPK